MTSKTPATIRRTTSIVSVLSILPHIFCCGIPAVMAIISLGTTVGLAGVLASNPFYQFVDQYHEILITLAITSVIISGILNFIAYRIDCHTAGAEGGTHRSTEHRECVGVHKECTHDNCIKSKRSSSKIFLFSLALLALDLAWFATEKFELGLHDHHEEQTLSH